MKFCDKLSKLRRDNNLSQEVFAEKLNVSRQAVSKWESDQSRPDMEKMIQMCKILNCNLEDLLDDGVIGETKKINKLNMSGYFNDFLKFITKTYNMFFSMTFKNKIKCIIEMLFIFIVLYLIGIVIFEIIDNLIFDLFLYIPTIGEYIHFILDNLFKLALLALGILIFIHLFKIRYLDYYITIEDQNVKEKTIEKEINENEEINCSKKEKIVIRDPKHSGFSFFESIVALIILFIKVMLVIFEVFVSLLFVILIGLIAICIFNLKYGIIFLFIILCLIGIVLVNYCIIEFIYNFIISKKQNYKKIFIIIISSLICFGLNSGFTISTYMTFEKTNTYPSKFVLGDTNTINMKHNLVLESSKITYKIDNSINNIKITSNHSFNNVFHGYDYIDNKYDVVYIHTYLDDYEALKLLFEDIKNKNTRDYTNLYSDNVEITVSKENYEKLINNYKNYIKDRDY